MTEQTQRSLSLVFVAFASSTLIYLFLGFLLGKTSSVPRPMASNQQMILILFVVLSLAQVLMVWFFRKKTYSDPLHPESVQALEDHLRGRHIVLFALSEIPAIFGLIYFFL